MGRTRARRRRSATALLTIAALQALTGTVWAAAPPTPAAADTAAAAVAPAASEVPAVAAPPGAAAPRDERDAALARLRGAQRSTTAAIVMSLPVPGWGQMYADSPFWGAVAFAAQMFYLGNILLESRRGQRQRTARDLEPIDSEQRKERDLLVTEHHERARDFVWWAAGALLLVSLDAYVSVALADFDNPGKPVPDLGPAPPAAGDGAGAAVSLSWRF